MLNFYKKVKTKKLKAQGVIEFCLSFIFLMSFFFMIVEFALFWHAHHANQTFADDILSNVSLYEPSEICGGANPEVLNIINTRAKRYLEPALQMQYYSTAGNEVVVVSQGDYFGSKVLILRISCAPSAVSVLTVRSDFLYHGFLFFTTGKYVTSVLDVQSPKF